MLFALILVSAASGGCSKYKDEPSPAGAQTTRLGALQFSVQNVTASDLYRPITLPNQSQFRIDTLEYRVLDQTALIIGSQFTGNTPPTQRCTLTQPLSANAIRQGQQSLATLELCHETVPPGTVIDLASSYQASASQAVRSRSLAFIEPVTSFSVVGFGRSVSFPLYEEDNLTGICNDSPVADVVQTLLSQIDFSQSMSCVPM